tara:strand:+ start:258 stop:515 length:258 start_codon:yes stop_codon:yes gene_type:complete
MKIFFYKTLLVAFVFFIVFKLTVGSLVNNLENRVYNSISKENIERVKENLRKQMYIAIEKDNFIKKEDAELINTFINKIKKDLNN